jgi:hypothetical protein
MCADIIARPLPLLVLSTITLCWLGLTYLAGSHKQIKITPESVDQLKSVGAHVGDVWGDASSIETQMTSSEQKGCDSIIPSFMRRSNYNFRISTQTPSAFFMQEIAKVKISEFHTSSNYDCCKWLTDPRIWVVLRQQFWSNLLSFHPVLSVYYHNPSDYFSTKQRLGIS